MERSPQLKIAKVTGVLFIDRFGWNRESTVVTGSLAGVQLIFVLKKFDELVSILTRLSSPNQGGYKQ
jgi:hypothetical protein